MTTEIDALKIVHNIQVEWAPWAYRSQPCIKPKCKQRHACMVKFTTKLREFYACLSHSEFALTEAIIDVQHD